MKKTIVALMALCSVALADYTWTGGNGTITSTQWADESNWTLSGGSVWRSDGSGPGTTNSNMWDTIVLDGAGIVVDSISQEGWAPKYTVKNGAVATFNLVKMQGASNGFTIGDGSSLTLNVSGAYKDNTFTYNVADTGSLTINLQSPSGVNANGLSVFNVGTGGSVTLTAVGSVTLGGGTVNATLADAGDGYIVTRELISLSNVSFETYTYNFGEGWTAVDEITGANQYKIERTATGISVSYMAVPEPTTATLSLLALAGLAARRRRK